ncbi:MAG: TonB-dependent receptor [Acidobacteria bacterium]|nr:TonB-dependent receptor [Acidobacteriota bacterium]
MAVPTVFGQTLPEVEVVGTVTDRNGAAVAGARVEFRRGAVVVDDAVTDGQGEFSVATGDGRGEIAVEARGFAPFRRVWQAGSDGDFIVVVLAPASISEQITVSADRVETRIGETAAAVTVLSRETLDSTPALGIDDALRQIPGFQLFRRTGSRAANPTAQGVSLRGVGASGASRAAVLLDGIPQTDAFGGWVYWSRIPREAVELVEVVRGGTSAAYGSGALGGLVSIRSRRRDGFSLTASGGNLETGELSLFAGRSVGGFGITAAVDALRSDGYFVVTPDLRGTADARAGSRYANLDLRVEKRFGRRVRAFAGATVFGEARANGTRLQTNRTFSRRFSGGLDIETVAGGSIALRVFGGSQGYDQLFSAVSASRATETMTRIQFVPSTEFGLSAIWSRGFGSKQFLLAGIETRRVSGSSDETVLSQNAATARVSAGGRETVTGIFAQDIFRVTDRLTVTGKIRLDLRDASGGFSETGPLTGAPTSVSRFPDRSEKRLSPHFSVSFRPVAAVSVFGSVYGAFRSPTLNELYRGFRVGNVVTLANERLESERLSGAEAGFGLAVRRFDARTVLFWSEVSDPVANVTTAINGGVITRQRRNAGRTRSRGVETEFEVRPMRRFTVSGGYLFADAVVAEFETAPELIGKRIPQVARHQGTLQLKYADAARLTAVVQFRATGRQFDDDLNQLSLGGYLTLDAFVSRPVGRRAEIFVAAENLTGNRYPTGRTPTPTVGPPVIFRAGFRIRLGKD